MLVKGLSRVFSKINLRSNPKLFFKVNSLEHRNRFYFHNNSALANVLPKPKISFSTDKIEDTSFREYIEKNNNFRSFVSEIANRNFTVDDKHESLKLLVKLKEDVENHDLWHEMIDCLKREMSTFEVEDFLKAIALASEIEMNKGAQKLFSKFFTTLDHELKIRTFDIDEILEILYVLKHTLLMGKSLKHSRFYLKTSRSFRKLDKFQPLQATHLCYYLENINDGTKSVYKYPLVKYTKEILPQLGLYEMGIILAALFRAKLFAFDPHFIRLIVDKVLEKIDSVKSIHLFYVCSYLHGCSSINNLDAVLYFQEKLIPHVSKFNTKSLITVLDSNYPFSLNLSYWNSLVERVKPALKDLTLYEIEKMIKITSAFKVDNKEEFLKLAVEEIEERENLSKYFPHVTNICKHLTTHRIYPKKLLDLVLSRDFIADLLTRSFSKEISAWSFLNFSLQIDKPEYQCMCLDKALKKKMARKIFTFRSLDYHILSNYTVKKRLYKRLSAIFGHSAVAQVFCLPHFEKGLLMRFDQDLKATELPEKFHFGPTKLIEAPLDEHFWVVLNASYISPAGLSPLQETYIRHLTALHYKPLLVQSLDVHHNINLGIEALSKYLEGVIQKALEDWQQQEKQKAI